MKLTIIGYWGGYPGKGGASSMYVLEKDDFLIVLDVGSGGLSAFQKYKNIIDIDAVVLSHYHADHIADIGVLQHGILVQSLLEDRKEKVPFYGHMEDLDQFQKLNHDYTKAVAYNPDEHLKLGPFFIRFLKTKHGVPCYGMRITDGQSTFVYTADTAYQEEWIPFTNGADMLLAECNFYAGQDAQAAGHMTSVDVANIAYGANVDEVILTHLPHFGNHEQLVDEVKESFRGNVQLAYEGLIWKARS